jgi:hypothetical protein
MQYYFICVVNNFKIIQCLRILLEFYFDCVSKYLLSHLFQPDYKAVMNIIKYILSAGPAW